MLYRDQGHGQCSGFWCVVSCIYGTVNRSDFASVAVLTFGTSMLDLKAKLSFAVYLLISRAVCIEKLPSLH